MCLAVEVERFGLVVREFELRTDVVIGEGGKTPYKANTNVQRIQRRLFLCVSLVAFGFRQTVFALWGS